MNILCIAAHPDDEVLGCGASLARLAREGNNVHIAILGEGITSRYVSRETAQSKLLSDLGEDAKNSARILGVASIDLFGFPDNRFDTVPLLEIIKTVEELTARYQPETVFTHHAGDLNVDHIAVNRAVLTACRPIAGSTIRDIYAFEIPSSTDWAFQTYAAFCPSVFIGVGETLELKLRAMAAYRSESRPFPHPRSLDALAAIARRWGSAAGLPAAEAFQLVRSIRP